MKKNIINAFILILSAAVFFIIGIIVAEIVLKFDSEMKEAFSVIPLIEKRESELKKSTEAREMEENIEESSKKTDSEIEEKATGEEINAEENIDKEASDEDGDDDKDDDNDDEDDDDQDQGGNDWKEDPNKIDLYLEIK